MGSGFFCSYLLCYTESYGGGQGHTSRAVMTSPMSLSCVKSSQMDQSGELEEVLSEGKGMGVLNRFSCQTTFFVFHIHAPSTII